MVFFLVPHRLYSQSKNERIMSEIKKENDADIENQLRGMNADEKRRRDDLEKDKGVVTAGR